MSRRVAGVLPDVMNFRIPARPGRHRTGGSVANGYALLSIALVTIAAPPIARSQEPADGNETKPAERILLALHRQHRRGQEILLQLM